LKILYKCVCKDKDIGYLPENSINIFFSDLGMKPFSNNYGISSSNIPCIRHDIGSLPIKNIKAKVGLASLIL
jgi:hypothetical protein